MKRFALSSEDEVRVFRGFLARKYAESVPKFGALTVIQDRTRCRPMPNPSTWLFAGERGHGVDSTVFSPPISVYFSRISLRMFAEIGGRLMSKVFSRTVSWIVVVT